MVTPEVEMLAKLIGAKCVLRLIAKYYTKVLDDLIQGVMKTIEEKAEEKE